MSETIMYSLVTLALLLFLYIVGVLSATPFIIMAVVCGACITYKKN